MEKETRRNKGYTVVIFGFFFTIAVLVLCGKFVYDALIELHNIDVRDLQVRDLLISKQDEYDSMLSDSTLEEDIKDILNNILDMYKEDNTVRLVLID